MNFCNLAFTDYLIHKVQNVKLTLIIFKIYNVFHNLLVFKVVLPLFKRFCVTYISFAKLLFKL